MVQGKPGKASRPAGQHVVRAVGPAGWVDRPLLGCAENIGGGGKKGVSWVWVSVSAQI
jgi:hypothetical protein